MLPVARRCAEPGSPAEDGQKTLTPDRSAVKGQKQRKLEDEIHGYLQNSEVKDQKKEDENAVGANLLKLFLHFIGQKIFQHMMAVQRGDGNEIEDHENRIDHDQKEEGAHEKIDCVRFGEKGQSAQYGNSNKNDQQVGTGAGQCDKDWPFFSVREVARVVRNRFCPAEHETPARDHGEKWQNNSAHDIGMLHGIERHASHEFGRGIAPIISHGRMGALMNAQRKEQA